MASPARNRDRSSSASVPNAITTALSCSGGVCASCRSAGLANTWPDSRRRFGAGVLEAGTPATDPCRPLHALNSARYSGSLACQATDSATIALEAWKQVYLTQHHSGAGGPGAHQRNVTPWHRPRAVGSPVGARSGIAADSMTSSSPGSAAPARCQPDGCDLRDRTCGGSSRANPQQPAPPCSDAAPHRS